MEEYGIDGWLAVLNAIPWDDAMDRVLEQWARWEYSLDDVRSPAEALAKLHEIGDQADQRHRYMTGSVAGRAVELVAKKTLPGDLVHWINKIIRQTSQISWQRMEIAGRTHYQIIESNQSFIFAGESHRYTLSWKGDRPMRSSDLVAAHAAWIALKLHLPSNLISDHSRRLREEISTAIVW